MTNDLLSRFGYKKQKNSHLELEKQNLDDDEPLYVPSSSPILVSNLVRNVEERSDSCNVPDLDVYGEADDGNYQLDCNHRLDLNYLDKEVDRFLDFEDDDPNISDDTTSQTHDSILLNDSVNPLKIIDQIEKHAAKSKSLVRTPPNRIPSSSKRSTANFQEKEPIVMLLVSYISQFHSSMISSSVLKAQTRTVQSLLLLQYQCDFFNPPIDCCGLFDFLDSHVDPLKDAHMLYDFKQSFLRVDWQANAILSIACKQLIEQKLARPIPLENIIVSLRISSIPQSDGQPYESYNSLRSPSPDQLVRIKGTVIRLSVPIMTPLVTIYICKNNKCRDPSMLHVRHNTNIFDTNELSNVRLVKKSVPTGKTQGLSSSGKIHALDLNCSSCGESMIQDPASGVYTALQSFCLALQPSLRGSVHTFIQQNAARGIQVGDQVEVTGTFAKVPLDSPKTTDGKLIGAYFKAVHIMPILKKEKMEDLGYVSIERLVSTTVETPYAVSATYVSLMGGGIVNAAIWRNLKLALLLSLVSINDQTPEYSHPLHLFIASDLNEPVLTRLLTCCASLKRHSLWKWSAHYSNPQDIISATTNSLFFPIVSSVKAGVLMTRFSSASAKPKAKNLVRYITSLDFQEKVVGSDGTGLLNQQQELHFSWNSVVWLLDETAEINTSKHRKGNLGQNQEFQLCAAAIQVSKTFALVVRPDTTDQVHETLSFDLLLEQTNKQLDPEVERAQLQIHCHLAKLIHEVSLINVNRIPGFVVDFLSSYLSRLRMALDDSSVSFSLQELIDVLETTCKSHAKLCKRSTVQVEDAVVAIYLLEESLWTQNGVGLIARFEPSGPVEDDEDVYVEMADCSKFAAFQDKLLDLLIGADLRKVKGLC